VRILVEGVVKRFGGVTAVDRAELAVAPGELFTLLGPSGCGKTTTLRMIAGFETPDEGRIRFGGQDVTDMPANRRGIGFVFQNYALFPHLPVVDNVGYGLEVRRVPAVEVAQRVAEVLKLVGLAGYEHQFPSQLSGGEQQRVALARAFVMRPKLLLADEPTGNLDATTGAAIIDLVFALNAEQGTTLLLVTHDEALAGRCARKVRLAGGRIQ